MKQYVDADLFLAVLKKEDRYKSAARAFLEKHRGDELFTSAITCMEVYFYLYRYGEKSALDALRALRMLCAVIDLRFPDIEEAAVLGERYSLSPADAVHAQAALSYGTIVSSDHSFDRVIGLTRIDFSRES